MGFDFKKFLVPIIAVVVLVLGIVAEQLYRKDSLEEQMDQLGKMHTEAVLDNSKSVDEMIEGYSIFNIISGGMEVTWVVLILLSMKDQTDRAFYYMFAATINIFVANTMQMLYADPAPYMRAGGFQSTDYGLAWGAWANPSYYSLMASSFCVVFLGDVGSKLAEKAPGGKIGKIIAWIVLVALAIVYNIVLAHQKFFTAVQYPYQALFAWTTGIPVGLLIHHFGKEPITKMGGSGSGRTVMVVGIATLVMLAVQIIIYFIAKEAYQSARVGWIAGATVGFVRMGGRDAGKEAQIEDVFYGANLKQAGYTILGFGCALGLLVAEKLGKGGGGKCHAIVSFILKFIIALVLVILIGIWMHFTRFTVVATWPAFFVCSLLPELCIGVLLFGIHGKLCGLLKL